ncbi:receptor-type tyrosine-protein phosphatase eta [Pseudorasbora parva]|uniref:receptor-type tyrosine-protein phosphatase eta n=1 Tax=Pseudorasbora parva TaxID=51549 RepID=UPI00351E3FFB
MADSSEEGSPVSGGGVDFPPPAGDMEPLGLAPEGARYLEAGLSAEMVETLLSSRAPSTRRLYSLKWNVFSTWCRRPTPEPTSSSHTSTFTTNTAPTSSSTSPSTTTPEPTSSSHTSTFTTNTAPTSSSTSPSTTTTAPTSSLTTASTTTVTASSSSTESTSTTLGPGVIENLRVTKISTSSVLLNWNETRGPRSFFEVQWTDTANVTNTVYNVTNLTPGVNYRFCIRVIAEDNSTKGEPVCISAFTEPDVIRNLLTSEVTTSSFLLTWDEPSGHRSFFKVYWIPGEKMNVTTGKTMNTKYQIIDLTAGVNCTFCIRAVAADNSTEGKTFCSSQPTNPENSTGLIAGIVVPIICLLFIITFILFFYSRRQTKKQCTDIPVHSIGNCALRIEDYEEYFKQKHADSNCGFAEDYEELKSVGTTQSKNSALAIENKAKNRYTNVLPYDASRVKLSMCGNPFDDYINANYVPGYNSRKEYIAAQGPLPITVNEFWRMNWEKNIYTIVMLTKCNELGRVKCEKYWPSDTNHYHNISVTTTSEISMESWTIRDFKIKNVKTAETRYIRQFHFTAWPDHGVPQTTEVLIDFRHLVREHMDQFSRHSPTVVHCSAGVGRTGTFIAIDHLIFQIERESMVDVYGIVNDMRMHRPLMVQTEEQYVYLHQCAYDIIRSRTGTNVDLIYRNTDAIYQNIKYMKS